MDNYVKRPSKVSSLGYLVLGGAAALSSAYGCNFNDKPADSKADARLKREDGLSRQLEREYVRSLAGLLDKDLVNKERKKGGVIVVPYLNALGSNAVNLFHERFLRGEETARGLSGFEDEAAYAASLAVRTGGEEEAVLETVTGTAGPSTKLSVVRKPVKLEHRVNPTATALIVDIEREDVIGLFKTADLVEFSQTPGKKLSDLQNYFDAGLVEKAKKLREAMGELGMPEGAPLSLSYLVEVEFAEATAQKAIEYFNADRIKLDQFKALKPKRVTHVERDDNGAEKIPNFAKPWHIEFFLDASGKVKAKQGKRRGI
ncbi:MAG: hypothetical protein AABW58_03760 [Nanoarchaeota archaeon]